MVPEGDPELIDALRLYPAMKDSGVLWLGEVPKHWEVRKLRQLLSRCAARNRPDLPLLSVVRERGVIQRDASGNDENHNYIPDDLSNYKVVLSGQFAMNKMKAWQGSYGVSQHEGIVSPAYFVFSLNGISGSFFNAAIRSRAYVPAFAQASDGVRIGQWDLSETRMREISFVIPPPEEQAAIVRFLDHADRKIRRYIRAKQKLIKLLEEQKQFIIHRAVTRGMDPSVPRKDSGISWLGEIPEHWEVRRVKHVARISRGKFTHRPRNDPSLYDGPYPFIQTGAVAQAAKFITSFKQTLNERGLAVSKLFRSGTLVMTIAANIGDVAILTFDACFPDSIVGFTPSSDVDRDYLYLAFLCMRPELLREAPVNTQGNLNIERVGTMGIPLPPFTEQQRITEQIATETGAFTNSISSLEREITLLREYRTRTIADVVTGKLEVREAAAGLPEEIEPLFNEEPDDEIEDPEPEEDEGSELP